MVQSSHTYWRLDISSCRIVLSSTRLFVSYIHQVAMVRLHLAACKLTMVSSLIDGNQAFNDLTYLI